MLGSIHHALSDLPFLLLSFYCAQPVLSGKRVLELGCGAGLLGVLLHRLGVGSACLTDGDAQTLRNCLHNLHINGAEVRCLLLRDRLTGGEFAQMTSVPCWHEQVIKHVPLQGPAIQVKHMQWEDCHAEPCDILLGADILYDPGEHRL